MTNKIKGSELRVGDFFRFSSDCTDLPSYFSDKTLMFFRTSNSSDGESIVGKAVDINGEEVLVINYDYVIPSPPIKSEEFE